MEKAVKETLVLKTDRNMASPTESAVLRKERREHSGAYYSKRYS